VTVPEDLIKSQLDPDDEDGRGNINFTDMSLEK
jgi:hypothetical protein